MIGLAFALLFAVTQTPVDYTVEPDVASFRRGITFVVTTEKKIPTKKTPDVKPVVRPAGRIAIRPGDLQILKPTGGD